MFRISVRNPLISVNIYTNSILKGQMIKSIICFFIVKKYIVLKLKPNELKIFLTQFLTFKPLYKPKCFTYLNEKFNLKFDEIKLKLQTYSADIFNDIVSWTHKVKLNNSAAAAIKKTYGFKFVLSDIWGIFKQKIFKAHLKTFFHRSCEKIIFMRQKYDPLD